MPHHGTGFASGWRARRSADADLRVDNPGWRFLLFQVSGDRQDHSALVRRLGGGVDGCLVFFQVALLAGYLYAHALIRYVKPRAQAALHVGLLALSALTLACTQAPV